jgi:hypothetical protein
VRSSRTWLVFAAGESGLMFFVMGPFPSLWSYAYVMGDGRNQSMQVFAAARGEPVVPNCLLRIAPGGADFEPGFFHEISMMLYPEPGSTE